MDGTDGTTLGGLRAASLVVACIGLLLLAVAASAFGAGARPRLRPLAEPSGPIGVGEPLVAAPRIPTAPDPSSSAGGAAASVRPLGAALTPAGALRATSGSFDARG